MRRIKLILFLFLFCIGIQPALAEGRDLLFEETFEKVVGTSDGKTKLNPSQLDNPSGRLFKIRIKIWYKKWCYIGVFKLLIFNTLIYKIVL